MSARNRYHISGGREEDTGWSGFMNEGGWWTGDTWQDAIRNMLEQDWEEDWYGSYQVVSETPSADGRSGIIELQVEPPGAVVGAKYKATLIED